MAIASTNPATGETTRTFTPLTADEVEQKLALAASVFPEYSTTTTFDQRSAWLLGAARILESEKERFGRIMTAEMGKTLASAIAEAEKCALGCRYYAEHAARHLADEVIATNASYSFVLYAPLGPVLAIMPWNFPFWQVFRFAAPALMAGNVGLLKHASNVPQCALAIEEILLRAGFPPGAFQSLLVESSQVPALLRDERIKAATLTGGEPAGASVASIAGHEIKKTVLELGGSDPFIVMPSANFDAAVATATKARNINNGQSCIAAKRFIVADEIYDRFQQAFVAAMQDARVGDPLDPLTDVGPLATEKIREELHDQVQRAVAAGATLLTGGEKLPPPGWFYKPTVLSNVPRQSAVFYEEFFGPVAMLFRVKDAREALAVANDSRFGLGSSVWTEDSQEVDFFIRGIEAGSVFVNGMVASDPRLPFGGVKKSGYGRELSLAGIREFVNAKTVWIK
ncbi:MAG: NAD-dependent succinate-semialdehyde dehydrogenase [Bryobacteraceae bacterium]